MYFITSVAIAGLLVAAVSGSGQFSIPPGSPDGFYQHGENEAGEIALYYLGIDLANNTREEITSYKHLPSDEFDARRATKHLDSRRAPWATCQRQYGTSSTFIQATQGLADWCGDGNKFTTWAQTAVKGTAVAYACNYGHGQVCTRDIVWDAWWNVRKACDSREDLPGYYSIPDWKASYGQTIEGIGFC